MIISDLNYMESVDTSEVQGGDSLAIATAGAIAVGVNALAITATLATAVPGGASALSASLAASS